MNAIEIRSLSKSYKQRKFARVITQQALDAIDLSVSEGEAVGFIGPNGAGKTTTIRVLTGAIRADNGCAQLFGVDVCKPDARAGLGYAPENPYLYDYLTPLETLTMGCRQHGLKVDNLEKHCMGWLERFDLATVAKKTIRSFSKGMTQRTALAHALAIKPKLLILDEPLSGLDPIGRKDVVDILDDYHKQGGTLFFSSHVLHDVERLANRFVMIVKGQIALNTTLADIMQQSNDYLIRSAGTAPLPGMAQDSSGSWVLTAHRDVLWEKLAQLEKAGHTLHDVRAQTSLEHIVMQIGQAR
ncbi:ABC transporter ATP-binding protein [Chitinilyticum litopenaei]|uniref:ABC transporter ATP-binding protein n=1 Tax=Chitinilyticum litopenaei TaxID=1121276 RepID=UPI00041C5B89|nr:ABC transporter ATP-binding protein [Chitinilyticum litopenaei]